MPQHYSGTCTARSGAHTCLALQACITLLPERMLQSDEALHNVVQLANALSTARFADFW